MDKKTEMWLTAAGLGAVAFLWWREQKASAAPQPYTGTGAGPSTGPGSFDPNSFAGVPGFDPSMFGGQSAPPPGQSAGPGYDGSGIGWNLPSGGGGSPGYDGGGVGYLPQTPGAGATSASTAIPGPGTPGTTTQSQNDPGAGGQPTKPGTVLLPILAGKNKGQLVAAPVIHIAKMDFTPQGAQLASQVVDQGQKVVNAEAQSGNQTSAAVTAQATGLLAGFLGSWGGGSQSGQGGQSGQSGQVPTGTTASGVKAAPSSTPAPAWAGFGVTHH